MLLPPDQVRLKPSADAASDGAGSSVGEILVPWRRNAAAQPEVHQVFQRARQLRHGRPLRRGRQQPARIFRSRPAEFQDFIHSPKRRADNNLRDNKMQRGFWTLSMLPARLSSYPDTHLHRTGATAMQLPVNPPRNAPVHSCNRDGSMRYEHPSGSCPTSPAMSARV